MLTKAMHRSLFSKWMTNSRMQMLAKSAALTSTDQAPQC